MLDSPCVATLIPIDRPIPPEEISPLVDQVHAGFRCADLLLRLPGAIPIPSFTTHPPLPSPDWVDVTTQSFVPEVVHHLLKDPSSHPLHPPVPFPLIPHDQVKIPSPPRSIIQSPLLVRPPDPSVYTAEGRSRFLLSVGIPPSAHDPEETRILIVSFGGQIFHAPRSRPPSPAPSRPSTPNCSPRRNERNKQVAPDWSPGRPHIPIGDLTLTSSVLIRDMPTSPLKTKGKLKLNGLAVSIGEPTHRESVVTGSPTAAILSDLTNSPTRRNTTAYFNPHKTLIPRRRSNSQRIATEQHLWLPGAPSAARKSEFASPITQSVQSFEGTKLSSFAPPLPMVVTTPPTPLSSVPPEYNQSGTEYVSHSRPPSDFTNLVCTSFDLEEIPRLLPEGWIAVVCGASKEQGEDAECLPEGFYIAPKDVYMPDLIAVADVLLGKLVGLPLMFMSSITHNPLTGIRKCLGSPGFSDSFRLRLQAVVHRGTRSTPPPRTRWGWRGTVPGRLRRRELGHGGREGLG